MIFCVRALSTRAVCRPHRLRRPFAAASLQILGVLDLEDELGILGHSHHPKAMDHGPLCTVEDEKTCPAAEAPWTFRGDDSSIVVAASVAAIAAEGGLPHSRLHFPSRVSPLQSRLHTLCGAHLLLLPAYHKYSAIDPYPCCLQTATGASSSCGLRIDFCDCCCSYARVLRQLGHPAPTRLPRNIGLLESDPDPQTRYVVRASILIFASSLHVLAGDLGC